MLCDLIAEGASRSLLLTALLHDIAEQFTGDSPQPFKKGFPEVRTILHEAEDHFLTWSGIRIPMLNEQETNILAAADILDVAYVALEEVTRGNRSHIQVFRNSLNVCEAVCLQGAAQAAFKGLLEGVYSEARTRGFGSLVE